MIIKPQPITRRFQCYSEEDARADSTLSTYAQMDDWQNHGGVGVHELPPCLQRIVYHYAELLNEVAAERGDTFEETLAFAARERLP